MNLFTLKDLGYFYLIAQMLTCQYESLAYGTPK